LVAHLIVVVVVVFVIVVVVVVVHSDCKPVFLMTKRVYCSE